MSIHDYLERSGRKPWIWGGGLSGFDGQDCTLFAADWAMTVSGRDPGDGVRGTYDDEAGAMAVLKEWGGPVPFVESRLLGIGWERSFASAMDGNIGVVRAPLAPLGVNGFIPAVRAGGLWVIRTLHGQRASSFECVAVFRQ